MNVSRVAITTFEVRSSMLHVGVFGAGVAFATLAAALRLDHAFGRRGIAVVLASILGMASALLAAKMSNAIDLVFVLTYAVLLLIVGPTVAIVSLYLAIKKKEWRMSLVAWAILSFLISFVAIVALLFSILPPGSPTA
jgi:hypothetical protein